MREHLEQHFVGLGGLCAASDSISELALNRRKCTFSVRALMSAAEVGRVALAGLIGGSSFWLVTFFWRLLVVIPVLTQGNPDVKTSTEVLALNRNTDAIRRNADATDRQTSSAHSEAVLRDLRKKIEDYSKT